MSFKKNIINVPFLNIIGKQQKNSIKPDGVQL